MAGSDPGHGRFASPGRHCASVCHSGRVSDGRVSDGRVSDGRADDDGQAGGSDDLDWVATRTPGAERTSWRTARIGWPSIILLLLALGGAGLGAASIGGWGGFALIVLLVVAVLALVITWADIVPEPRDS